MRCNQRAERINQLIVELNLWENRLCVFLLNPKLPIFFYTWTIWKCYSQSLLSPLWYRSMALWEISFLQWRTEVMLSNEEWLSHGPLPDPFSLYHRQTQPIDRRTRVRIVRTRGHSIPAYQVGKHTTNTICHSPGVAYASSYSRVYRKTLQCSKKNTKSQFLLLTRRWYKRLHAQRVSKCSL